MSVRSMGRMLRSAFFAVLAMACFVTAVHAAGKTEEKIVSSEIEGRRVVVPPDLPLALDWYSPQVHKDAGQVTRGWVIKDVVLLETDKKNLICIRRADGTELWRVVLEHEIRYEPAVSNNNVVVNTNNHLLAIDKVAGEIRWRLLPKFVMSTTPMVIDPPRYPLRYSREWTDLESIYVGSWTGRIHAMSVRGRLRNYVNGLGVDMDLSAPEFQLNYSWHKTHETRGIITKELRIVEGMIYYVADDKQAYAVTRDAETRAPYLLQGLPTTDPTLTPANLFVGTRDFSVYALDRLTLKRKWTYPMGAEPSGRIYADEPSERPLVFVPSESAGVHALAINPTTGGTRGGLRTPESYDFAWKVAAAQGVVTSGPSLVYLGSERTKDFPGFKKLWAVEKDSGKVAWGSESTGVRFYLQFHNRWKRSDETMRVFAVTDDNRLLSFEEKSADHGPLKPSVVQDAGDGKKGMDPKRN